MITYKYKHNKHKRHTRRKGGKASIDKRTGVYVVNRDTTKYFIHLSNLRKYENYFNGVNIDTTLSAKLLKTLLNAMNFDNEYNLQIEIDKIITSNFPFEIDCDRQKKTTWKNCNGYCIKTLQRLVTIEINSTAYMLRTFSKSMLWAADKSKKHPVSFTCDNIDILTGIWKDDYKKIKITIDEKYNSTHIRLIMGFGPSAAGKTYWAQNFINIFSQLNNFPKLFVSIDGGIYRETSMVYQMIINTVKKTCIGGLSNLVADIGDGIFKSGTIKKNMMEYLNDISQKFSLYVPETLGGCGWPGSSKISMLKKCNEVYDPYINYTGDNEWIGLLIWQHLFKDNCIYSDEFKCEGCNASGTRRQYNEGKKYSSNAYTHAIEKGYKHVTGVSYKTTDPDQDIFKGAPGGKFIIHNTGRATHKASNGKSTSNTTQILDISNQPNKLSTQIKNKTNSDMYNYIYKTATLPIIKTQLSLA